MHSASTLAQPQHHEDPNSQTLHELEAFELIYCPNHPTYHVEAFCPKDTLKSGLLCIKCILHPDISKEIRSDTLEAIKDLISKSAEKSTKASIHPEFSRIDGSKESFDAKFLDYSTKDYVGLYDRHVETQMSKLDKELDRIRESLAVLRDQFVKFFEKQAQTLKKKDEDFKQKALEYFEEKEKVEKLTFSSVNDILRELSTINEFEEYEKFVRALFKKVLLSRGDGEGSLTKKLTNMMEEVKTQVSNMRTMRVDTQILEDIREGIESINILDKSTIVAGVPSLNSNLERTLEKVRKLESKSAAPELAASIQRLDRRDKDSSEKTYLYTDSDLRKPSALSKILKEKYGVDNLKKLLPGQQTQNANRQAPYLKNEDKRPLENNAGWRTSTSTNNIATRSNTASDNKLPLFGHNPKKSHLDQPNHKNKTRMIVEKEGTDSEDLEEEAPSSRKLLVKDRTVSFQQNANHSQVTFAPSSQQQTSQQSKRISPSPTRTWQNEDNQNASPTFAKTSAEKQPSFEFDTNSRGKGQENSQRQSKKIKESATMEEENTDDQDKNSSGFSKSLHKELAKNASESDNPKGSLINQWIDQKVNGFLIYQNTLKEQTTDPIDDFNKYASEKWFHLSKPERDEYSVLALTIRAELKQEFQDLSVKTPEISQLQELLDQRVKELKK